MGVVSFTILMLESSKETPVDHTWIEGVDFAHVVLFYVSILFVFHAFYIMFISFRVRKEYVKFHAIPFYEMLSELNVMSQSRFRSMLFDFPILPLSSTRGKAEFKIASRLFIDAYKLPESFDFALYLCGCFGRYALKTINRGVLSWGVLVSCVVLNFLRQNFDGVFSCGQEPVSFGRRLSAAGNNSWQCS